MEKDVLVHALIGSGKFTDAQRPYLNTLTVPVLETLMAAPTPSQPSAPSAPAPTPSTPSQPSAPAPSAPTTGTPGAVTGASAQTLEQYIASAPAHLQSELRAAAESRTAKRNATIAALKATGRCTFTDAQLATKTDQELEQMAALASAPVAADYSARGLATGTVGEDVPEPPSLTSAIVNARANQRAAGVH